MSRGPALARRDLLTAASVLPFARGAAAQRTRTLRVGHTFPAEGVVAHAIDHVSAVLTERSGGRLRLEQVPEGRLGTQRALLQQLIERELDISIAPPSGLAIGCMGLRLFDLAFVARDLDHLLRMFASLHYQTCLSVMENSDLTPLRAFGPPWYLGTRHIMTRWDRPIIGPGDLSGLQLRVGDGPALPAIMTALGARPVRMAEGPELAEALRSGALDGLEGSLVTIAKHGLLSVQGCLALTSHLVMTLLPVMNTQAWHLLHAEEQTLLQDALRAGGAQATRLVQEHERTLHEAFARHAKLRITRPDLALFRRALEEFYRSYLQPMHPSILAQMEAL